MVESSIIRSFFRLSTLSFFASIRRFSIQIRRRKKDAVPIRARDTAMIVVIKLFDIFIVLCRNIIMRKIFLPIMLLLLHAGCSASDETVQQPPTEAMYFPPAGGAWDTKPPAELNWNDDQVQPLLDYLELHNTKSFMVLVNGRIAMEHYFNGHTASSPWYWASAGKTLTATLTGIAASNGALQLNDKVSDYLGMGWTSTPADKENLITVKHLLSMTSGLDDASYGDCVSPDCLTYIEDAGSRWAYHNVYVKLQDIVAAATGQSWDDYFTANLKSKICMTGMWIANGGLQVYWSNTRSMARFGLLALNQGKWDDSQVVDASFMSAATSTSQNINQAYGYLWWLNGKSSFHLPQTQLEFPGSLVPAAPADMYMALGKNDQKIYVVPSKKMVVIRMGDAADDSNFALSEFDNGLWEKISAVVD